MFHFSPWKLVSRILAVLLLAAAFLKSYGLAVEPISRMGFFSEPWFQVLLVEMEVLLALWLLWGYYPFGSWIAVTLAFTSFAGVSFYLGLAGQSSCGSF